MRWDGQSHNQQHRAQDRADNKQHPPSHFSNLYGRTAGMKNLGLSQFKSN
jgi:hypothetical protein